MNTRPFLILGSSGNIGTAAAKILCEQGSPVIAADWNDDINKEALIKTGLCGYMKDGTLKTVVIDAKDTAQLSAIIKDTAPVVCLSTLPAGELSYNAAIATALAGKSYISSNFITAAARENLDERARTLNLLGIQNFNDLLRQQGVSSAWERGLDPGLDSWLFRQALDDFIGGEINVLKSTGAGVSEHPEDIYFYTWAGITNGMGHRPARIIIDGKIKNIAPTHKFHTPHRKDIGTLCLSDKTLLETYANDDGALHLLEQAQSMGVKTGNIQIAATLTGRHQGHCALWDPLVRILNILDDTDIYEHAMSMADLLKALIVKEHSRNPDFAKEIGHQDLNHLVQAVTHDKTLSLSELRTCNALTRTLDSQEFFSSRPLNTGRLPQTAKNLTEAHLAHIYRRQEDKRDRSIINIEIEGYDKNGTPLTKILEINAYGDPSINGLSSMQKTVAGTLAQAAHLANQGKLPTGLNGAGSDYKNGLTILQNLQRDKTLTMHSSKGTARS